MFAPLWHGWPLAGERLSEQGKAQRARGRGLTLRQRALMRGLGRARSGSYWTYFAVSPCGRYAKVGRSWNPVIRVHDGTGFRGVERRLGIEHVYLARAYDGDVERMCHEFLAPDAVDREWFRVGPRLRILVARLDRLNRRMRNARKRRRRVATEAPAPQVEQNAA